MFNFNKQFAVVIGAARVVRQAARSWVAHGLTLALLVSFSMLVGTSSFSEGATSPAQPDPAPDVTLIMPSEVLIGEDFTFTVTFKSTGGAIGYGPYIDLYLPAWGADGNGPFSGTPQKCDGINFVSAETLFTNPSTVALAPSYNSGIGGSPPCPYPYTHPFPGATVLDPTPAPSGQYQLVVLELPFGSFDPSQPDIIVRVTAHVSDFADAGTPLTIYARGGFRYGADALNNHPADPLIESSLPPVSAQTTPTVFTLKKDYLGPEGPGNWEAVSGPNFIQYYPLKYQITVDIADGQVIDALIITDNLPGNLQFAGIASVGIGGTEVSPVLNCPGPVAITPPSTSTPGGTLIVTLCDPITGQAMPDDIVITFEFYIPEDVLDADCAPSPVLVKNDVKATGKWDPLDPRS